MDEHTTTIHNYENRDLCVWGLYLLCHSHLTVYEGVSEMAEITNMNPKQIDLVYFHNNGCMWTDPQNGCDVAFVCVARKL